jgi:hypothetical protein
MRLASRLMAVVAAMSAWATLTARVTYSYVGDWARFNTDINQSSFEHRFTSWEVTVTGAVRPGRRRSHRLWQFFQLQRNQVLGRGREIAAGGSWWLAYQAVPE